MSECDDRPIQCWMLSIEGLQPMLFEELEDAHRFLDQLHPRTRAKLGSRWSVDPVRLNRGPGDDVTAIVMSSDLNPTGEITFSDTDE